MIRDRCPLTALLAVPGRVTRLDPSPDAVAVAVPVAVFAPIIFWSFPLVVDDGCLLCCEFLEALVRVFTVGAGLQVSISSSACATPEQPKPAIRSHQPLSSVKKITY